MLLLTLWVAAATTTTAATASATLQDNENTKRETEAFENRNFVELPLVVCIYIVVSSKLTTISPEPCVFHVLVFLNG